MRILLGIVLLFVFQCAVAKSYLCVADSSVGFRYDKSSNAWVNARFKNSKDRYIVSKDKSKRDAYIVTKVGSKFLLYFCKNGFNTPGYLFCEGMGGFRFNRDNGRFILTYMSGYYNVIPNVDHITDETSDTPFIEIGECSSF